VLRRLVGCLAGTHVYHRWCVGSRRARDRLRAARASTRAAV